ncbi:hypothetical protein JCM11251_002246 [Rhodosporidiobolus azoricus]
MEDVARDLAPTPPLTDGLISSPDGKLALPPHPASHLSTSHSSLYMSKSKSSRQWRLLPSLLVLLPLLFALAYTSVHLHYTLPTPSTSEFTILENGTAIPIFSELRAMRYITDLSEYEDGTPRYRIVGTKEMVQTDEYLLARIEEIKAEMVRRHPEGGMQIEVWHQVGDGTHLFDFMGKMVWKKYFGISNVIVRLSDGTAASKANSILLNAHSDSTLPSPGAADDLIGVAVMLESLRVMALGERKMTNAAIFLFNGAEESLQDASHLFITQHPLKDTIRGVINLEACGTDGKEIVFQATSAEMIHALSRAPSPYATVIASEIFQTGLILSDTDFRQFAEYGNLTGIDAAVVQNSYLYHTALDIPSAIQPGAIQHMGLNTLALLEYFTSPETSLGNSPEGEATEKLPLSKPGETVFFSALGGRVFVVYSRAKATFWYGVLAAVVAVVVTDRVDWSDKRQRKVYVLATVSVAGSLVAAVVGANAAAAILSGVMGKGMSWFRNESYPLLVFGPPSLLAILLTQYTLLSNPVRSRLPTLPQDAAESSLLEHASLVSLIIYYTLALLAGHAAGIGSSYLFAVGAVGTLVALVVNDYGFQAETREKKVHLATYVIGQALPLLLGVEGIIGFLDLFVPLTGRLGADAPVDHIIASLVSAVGYLTIPMLLPFCHRYGASFTARFALFLTFLTAGTLGWFSRPSWGPYNAAHPKRLLVLHMENTTTSPPEFHLHVATTDSQPFADLVTRATAGLTASADAVPEPTVADDLSVDWDLIYPISQLLTTYKVALPPADPSYVSPFDSTFVLSVEKSILNSVKQTRRLELVLDHPGVIWPVVSFNADVVEWDLPTLPERGAHVRHHVKSVASYGVTKFTLSLTVQLTPDEFGAALREDQRRKGQRTDSSAADEALARIRIDYSGLDVHGMYPASAYSDDPVERATREAARREKVGMRFFEKFSEKLREEPVDAMLLSAVAGVAYV